MNTIANLWLKSSKISTQSKKYIMNLTKKEMDDSFTENKMSFGTAGIREIMGPGTNRINSFTYQQMAHGYAQYILKRHSDNPSVVIGHDNRMNADMFALVCAKVLTSFGIKVFLFKNNELMPTPIISYTIKHLGLNGGIIVTASHNPKNYLGFKAYNETGGQIMVDEAHEIEQYMPENSEILDKNYISDDSLISYLDDQIVSDYFKAARSCLINTNIEEEKNEPIVFTAHHGTASYLMPSFLETLGYKNVILAKQQCVPDSNFTYSLCSNPEDPTSFELAEKYASKANSNIMLGVDPDADRLAVVVKHNNGWRYLTGNEMGIIFTYYVLSNKKFNKQPFIVSTYVSTYLIDAIASHYGAKVYRTGTGFKWLGNKVTERENKEDFVVAFEEAIGSLNSTINKDKDSFQAAALALEIYNLYAKKGMTLIDLLEKEIYPNFGYWSGGTISYTFKTLNWKEEMEQKMNYFKSLENIDINGIQVVSNKWNQEADALEWDLGNGMWIKFRKSGTEPKFKIYYNVYGNSIEESNEIHDVLKKYMSELIRY